MRGVSSALLNSNEHRHRQSGSFGSGEETNKRRLQRTKDAKDVDKFGHGPVQDRSSICKFLSLKIVLVCIILCTCITVFFSPAVIYYDNPTGSGSRFVDVGWLWERTGTNAKYISDLNIDWIQVSTVLEKTIKLGGHQTVGLLNFNSSEVHEWQKILPGVNSVSLSLEHVRSGVTWETLYPEWIDEEEESEGAICPSMPMLEVQTMLHFSFIAVKLPC